MKTVKGIAWLCVMTILFSGCTLPLPTPSSYAPKEAYGDPNKYLDEFRTHLQYQQLNDSEKHGYGQIYTAVRDSEQMPNATVSIDGKPCPGVRIPLSDIAYTREQMSHLFETFFRDNPQFFYLDRTYSLEGYEKDGVPVYNTLLLQFTMDADERKRAVQTLNEVTDAILDELPQTTDEYAIELYLHDRLLSACVYDDYAASVSSNECANAYSAYGALIEGKAVCEGYAKAMQLLLNACSIPTTVVLGRCTEDGEAHMWNLTRINGAYYYLDPTWDDNGSNIQYTYFNVNSKMLSRTHTIDTDSLSAISCTALADNYHYRNGTYIDTYERDEIAKVIANGIQRGDTAIHLRFAEGKYENALLFIKNLPLTQKTVNKFLSNLTMWDYELYTLAKQETITILKK